MQLRQGSRKSISISLHRRTKFAQAFLNNSVIEAVWRQKANAKILRVAQDDGPHLPSVLFYSIEMKKFVYSSQPVEIKAPSLSPH